MSFRRPAVRFAGGARAARCALALACLFPAGRAAGQEAFRIAGITAAPGSAASGHLEVAPAGGDAGTSIPLTVVHGARPGPVLTLVAGIHGSEYAPILALQRLRPLLDPGEQAGTVVLVHIANLPAFLGRTIYFGPDDRVNLNRSFPGKPDGSLTERVAHVLTEQVISRSDYLLDIHSGDGNEWLRPSYTGYYAEAGGPEVIEESRRMALAFGLDTIVRFRGDLDAESAIWCGAAAVARGIPSIDVESGEMGLIEDRRIEPIVDGVLSVMRHLGMMPGEPAPTANPLFVSERAYATSEHDGVREPEPLVRAGQYVREGAALGVVRDFHGNLLTEVRAPADGLMLILLGTPPVNRGETIAVIARIE